MADGLIFRPRAAAAIAFPRSHPFLQAVCWARSYSAYISSTVMASCRSVTQTSLLCFEAGDDGFCLLDVWGHDHHHGGGSQRLAAPGMLEKKDCFAGLGGFWVAGCGSPPLILLWRSVGVSSSTA